MYHRKSNAARSGHPITAPLPSGTLEIPEFHLILWDRISRREETVTPPDALFSNGCRKGGTGLREGHGRQPAITLVNGGTLKGPKSHYQKSPRCAMLVIERKSKERGVQGVSNSLCPYSRLMSAKIEKWQFFSIPFFQSIYIHREM